MFSDLRVHVILHRRWEHRVKGLCDNFGDSSNGEFETSTKVITTDAVAFAKSWNIDPTCSDDYNPDDYKACVSILILL